MALPWTMDPPMPMDGDGNGDDLKGRKGINMMLVIWIHAFCATLVMIARWFARWNLADTSKHGAVNMTFATISWVLGLASQILLSTDVGKDQDKKDKAMMLKSWAASCINIGGIVFARLAIIAFLKIAHDVMNPKSQGILWVIAATSMGLAMSLVTASSFHCWSLSSLWVLPADAHSQCDLAADEGSYKNNAYFALFVFSWFSFTGFLLTIYPLAFMRNLYMNKTMKVFFCILSALATFASVWATFLAYGIYAKGHANDVWNLATISTWTWVEQWQLILASSVRPLRSAYLRVQQRRADARAFEKAMRRERSSIELCRHDRNMSAHAVHFPNFDLEAFRKKITGSNQSASDSSDTQVDGLAEKNVRSLAQFIAESGGHPGGIRNNIFILKESSVELEPRKESTTVSRSSFGDRTTLIPPSSQHSGRK